MSAVTVTGYYADGVAYAAHLDDSEKVDMTGVVQMAPPPLLSAIEAAAGEVASPFATGGPASTIGLDSIDGVLAYLTTRTEVLTLTGDVPPAFAPDNDDDVDVAVDH